MVMGAHSLPNAGRRWREQQFGEQNVSKGEIALLLQDRAGGLRPIRLAGKISSAQA